MKLAATALIGLSLAATAAGAVAATATARLSDFDYLKANRCKGIASATGSADAATLDAFLRTEGRSREPIILSRGDYEMHRAEQQARDANQKARLSAELSGPCAAYTKAAGSMKAAGSDTSSTLR